MRLRVNGNAQIGQLIRVGVVTQYSMSTTLVCNRKAQNNLCTQLVRSALTYKHRCYTREKRVVHEVNQERLMTLTPSTPSSRDLDESYYRRSSAMQLRHVVIRTTECNRAI